MIIVLILLLFLKVNCLNFLKFLLHNHYIYSLYLCLPLTIILFPLTYSLTYLLSIGLEGVRKRPSMYIGSLTPSPERGWHGGLAHLVEEILMNSIDEYQAGMASDISLILLPHGLIQIRDNGRGIPWNNLRNTTKSALEVILSTLHSGGKFGDNQKNGYKSVTGGLHGVGLSVVNALSTYLQADVGRKGQGGAQILFQRGKVFKDLIRYEENEEEKKFIDQGTSITFLPDSQIFQNIYNIDWVHFINRLKDLSQLYPGLKLSLIDARSFSLNELDVGLSSFLINEIIKNSTSLPKVKANLSSKVKNFIQPNEGNFDEKIHHLKFVSNSSSLNPNLSKFCFYSSKGIEDMLLDLSNGRESIHPDQDIIKFTNKIDGKRMKIIFFFVLF